MRFHVLNRVVQLLNSSATGVGKRRGRVSSFRTFAVSLTDHIKANGLTNITATLAMNKPKTVF